MTHKIHRDKQKKKYPRTFHNTRKHSQINCNEEKEWDNEEWYDDYYNDDYYNEDETYYYYTLVDW